MLTSGFASSAFCASLNLSATADNGSRFISHSFGGLFELGRTRESSSVIDADGAFHYSELPDYVPLGRGGVAFPSKNDFAELGVIEYDDATGEIFHIELDFAKYVAPGEFLFAQFFTKAPTYTTSFNSISGTIEDVGAETPTVNLLSEIVFTYDGSTSGDGLLHYTGVLSVTDNVFALAVDDTAFSQNLANYSGDGDIRVEWDVAGTLIPSVAVVPLSGDFNFDGVVNLADYTVWRNHLGSSFDLNGNGDETGASEGTVDTADYALWKANLGAVANTSTTRSPHAVPEPAAYLLAVVVGSLAWNVRRSRLRERAEERILSTKSRVAETFLLASANGPVRMRSAVSVLMLCLSASSAMAATLELSAMADNGSRFIEHRQGAFWELGQTRESSNVDNPDGAFTYSELPNYVQQGGGGTAFPSKNNFWKLGVIEYDESTGEITDLEFDFEPYVAPGRFTFYQFIAASSAYTTSFNSFSGTVIPTGNGLPTINLTSEIVFSIDSSGVGDGVLAYTGSLNVSNNAFVLDVDDSNFSPTYEAYSGNGDLRVEWNVTGTLSLRLAGDFNRDGRVNLADYTVWRNNLVSEGTMVAGDANEDQVVDANDYIAWKETFGLSAATPVSTQNTVPEPATSILLLMVVAAFALTRSVAFSKPVELLDTHVG